MKMTRPKTLLKEYVKEILAEEGEGMGGYSGFSDAGFGSMGMGGGMGGSGGGMYGVYGDGDQLYKVFVKPFVDVIGVAAGKTKEVSRKGLTVIRVAFEALATSLIPVLTDDYAEIFAKEQNDMEKIKSEYADVYQATWDAFKNHDVMLAAFCYRPDLFLTSVLAKKAPAAVSKLLSVLSGGALDQVLSKLDITSKSGGRRHESVIREDEDHQESKLQKLVSNKKVKNIIANSSKTKQMSALGAKLTHRTLTDVFNHASTIMKAKSIDDIQKMLGKKLPGLDKLHEVPEQERHEAEQKLLSGVKKGMKALYITQLEAHVKEAVAAGVPQDHPFVTDYNSVIQKIKSL